MTEYIVSQEQFETIARAVLKNIDRPITEVVVGADKLPEIVRCRDCKHFHKVTPDRHRTGTVRMREFVEARRPKMKWDEVYDAAVAEGFMYKDAKSLRTSYYLTAKRATVTKCAKFGICDPNGFCAWASRKENAQKE